ncbi:MAG: BatB protein, partial [Alphaproteobacteria bacterium]|nr:BatB protein [Alphaproteobacteria bacterium]
PEQSLEMAKKDGIRVYTIGIGSLPYTVNTFFGRRQVNPASGLDEKTLRKIAEYTGGKYFRATTTADMHKIYDEIDKLEPIDTETNIIYPTKELYFYPLLLALILGFIGFYIREEV